MAGIEDNKDKNIEMAETESLGDMEKSTAEDTLTEDKSEMTIQQLYQEFLADRKYNAQRTAEFDRNIKQSEARIDKICVGLITAQAEQKEAMNINNEQMGAISQHLQQSEDRIDHKASEQHTITETICCKWILSSFSNADCSAYESMANPPPPTFMTPIMTTSSAPGALTGLPQQQADSTDRSRKGQRKPKERGNSSSSDSSLEREYTRWQENSVTFSDCQDDNQFVKGFEKFRTF
ncbi:unnamed protein product [Mytilus coruscus]|uniref:Uncharacterized protein n=1 Tax=Mytilus coruscus TaxID=42192 RepID=A0A6J8E2W0_MYTCO|nr:unnamed protein product [Mytilus coruscus]